MSQKTTKAMTCSLAACRWDDALRVATSSCHPQAEMLKHQHYQWLLQTAQEEKAAAVKEADGDFTAAISLFLKGGLPARAAQVGADIWDKTNVNRQLGFGALLVVF
jgi:intraflagellar transport protein 172